MAEQIRAEEPGQIADTGTPATICVLRQRTADPFMSPSSTRNRRQAALRRLGVSARKEEAPWREERLSLLP
jgi:hypothetical protein